MMLRNTRMDFIPDHATTESDLSFQDDSTSSSSPLSAAICEDVDDLHLGAEAIMFSRNFEDNDIECRKKPLQNFTIVKNNVSILGQDDYNYSFSTISSISDLIDAREGNPEDLLYCLGFSPLEAEESHFSILSRFSSPPDRGSRSPLHDQQVSQTEGGAEIVPIVHDGIIKTQEWLNSQEDLNSSLQQISSTPKDATANGKATNVASQNQGKRLSTSKRRLRWSRSRQSSFEHLLPNLEEEETVTTAGDPKTANGSQKDATPIGPIRESSQEKDEISILIPGVNKQEPTHSSSTELTEELCKLDSARNQELNCHCQLEQVTATQTEVITSKNTVCSAAQPEETLLETLPVRLLPWKRSNFAMMKVDSFELEEIASNDGRLSPNFVRLVKPSMSTVIPNLITINQSARGLTNDEDSANRSSPSSESSSGFDEGLEDLLLSTQRQHSASSTDDSKKILQNSSQADTVMQLYADNLSESVCSMTDSAMRSSWEKVLDFCSLRSKIACASGIAEYALLRSKMRTNPSKFGNSAHKNRSKSSSISSIHLHKNGIENSLSFTGNSSFPANGRKQFSRLNGSNGCNEVPHLEDGIRRKGGLSSIVSRSYSGISNVNNSNSTASGQRLGPGNRRLYRFSSLPTLTAVPLSPFRKTSCQSYFLEASHERSEEQDCTLSLMSNISDVTYLSYRASQCAAQTEPKLKFSHAEVSEITTDEQRDLHGNVAETDQLSLSNGHDNLLFKDGCSPSIRTINKALKKGAKKGLSHS